MVTAKMLKQSGYDVITANSGKKAVGTALIDPSIDLILMDIDLGPGINGTEAARQILETRDVPIVFLTSHSEQSVVESVKEITRYGYVIKNSGNFVLLSSIDMAFELFDSHSRLAESADHLRISEERVRARLDSILSPDGDVGVLEFIDIIDTQMLQSVLEDFNTITDISVGIVDLEGLVIANAGFDDVCVKFHRPNSEACRNCIESNTLLAEGIIEGTYKLIKCKNNMWEMITPVNIGGKIAGNLFLGQFFFDDDVLDYDLFRSQAKQYGFNEEDYIAALESVPRLGRDEVFTAMTFYIKFVNIISRLSYSNIKLARTLAERDRYSELHKESEGRLSDVTEYMADLVVRLDEDGFYTYVSPSFERVLGYRQDELVGTWAADIAHPADKEQNIKDISDMCLKGEGSVELRQRHKDGTYRWFEVTGRNISGENGAAAGAVLGARDITERNIAEKKFNRRNKQYKDLFENMIDGFAIHEIIVDEWGTPVDYVFLEVNPAFESFTGLNPEYIIGKRVTELIPDIEPYWIATYGQVAFTGVRLTIENYSAQLDKWFKVTAYSPERGYFATIFEDITDRKKSEDLLKERDERYKRLFESVVGYIYTVFIGNGIPVKTVHGPGCEAVTGYIPEDFDSDPELWYKMIYPDDRGRVVLFASDIINRGVFNCIEHRIICRDGSMSWVRNTPVPHYDANNNLIEYDSVIADITERKIVETALEESEEMLLNIVNSSPDYIFVKDTELKVVLCNKTYASAMNKKPRELIGLSDVESGWGEDFVKGNIQKGIRGWEQDDRRALSGETVVVENETAVINGIVHYFDTIKIPLYKNGVITSLLGISRDKTGQVLTRKKLLESEDKFRAIAENAPLGVYTTDKNGDCVYANHRWLEMAGMTFEEAAGKGWVDAIHRDDRESVSEKWYRSVQSGGVWGYDYRFLNKSGKETWVYGNASAITSDDGEVTGYVGTNIDITERKHLFEKINSLLKEKELLLTEVHHRIKNNMNTISGLLMLQAASMSDGAAVTALNDARSRVQSMMLMYDKLYRSEDYRKINIKEYFEKFIDDIFLIFENSRQITIIKDIEDFILDTKTIFPMGIVINELITNAFKYAFPDGRKGSIKVSICKSGDEITLAVSDDGAGLPDEIAASKSGGFGLNLVSALTEQIGGEVNISNENGTRVEIVFSVGF